MTAATDTDDPLGRVVAVINGKGGVLKTSVVANVAGQLAKAGYRILAADLDLGANLKLDLGYVGDPLDDDGKGLLEAIWSGAELPIIRNVRAGLDVIPGGRQLEMLTALAYSPMAAELQGGGVPQEFARRLSEVAANYDLVLLDCSPGNPVLQDLALAATRYLVIPSKTDAGGWDGLRMVGPRVKKARAANPQLAYLGAVLVAHQTTATRILTSTKDRLAEVEDTVPLFDTFIRHSETAAHDCRNRGQLAHELAADAAAGKQERLALLSRSRGRHRAKNLTAMPTQLSAAADSLAGDYEALSREILLRIAAHEQTVPLAATGR